MYEPLPMLALKRALDALPVGLILEMISTDPGSQSDIPAWCRCTGHEIIEMHQRNDEYSFYIRKTF